MASAWRSVAPLLAAAGCRLFFVATLDEGIALRRLLPTVEIAVLNGLLPGTGGEFSRARLIPVLNDLGEIAAWRGRATTRALPAMIHVDTGMTRLGLGAAALAETRARPGAARGLRAARHHQPPRLRRGCRRIRSTPASSPTSAPRWPALPPAPASLAASSGIFLGTAFHFDFVRPGAALYGVNPTPGQPNPMAQVVRVKGRILQVRDVDRGVSVGYGAAHRMERAGRIATVAVGYADGWLRSASDRGSAGIAGQRVPVIGRISMDLMTLDVTGIDPSLARAGAFVDLIDETYGVDEAAAAAGTIGYEILTALGRRYHRIYRGAAG